MSQSLNRNARWDVSGGDLPRDLFPSGRIRISLASRDPKIVEKRRALCQELRADQEWSILHGLARGLITIAEVQRRDRQGGVGARKEIRDDIERIWMGGVPTVADEIAAYTAWYAENRRPRSARNVESRLKRFAEQERPGHQGGKGVRLGTLLLDEVRSHDVEHALRSISAHPTTQENIRVAISGLFSWSIKREMEAAEQESRKPRWVSNPAKLVESRQKVVRVVVLSREDVVALLRHAEPYQSAYLRMFLHLGLRQMELIHLRLGIDLNLRTWELKIQARPADPRCPCDDCQAGGWMAKNVNSGRSMWVPPTPPALRGAILQYLEQSPAGRGDFLLRNPRTNEIWNARSLQADFQSLCERAGIPYGRDEYDGAVIHTLRHTCATRLVQSGVDHGVVADLLGDTIGTIKKTYVHLEPRDLGRAVQRGPSYDV